MSERRPTFDRMRYHHTKNKGDLGVAQAIADLVEKGWGILLPMTEHAAFDLVAFRDETFLRVQVKYRSAVQGVVFAPFKTCWADRHGVHTQPIDRSSIDVFCVYCPDTRACYYVDPATITTKGVYLRIEPTRNNIAKRVTWAKDFTEIPSTVRGIRARLGPPLEREPLVRHSREPRAVYRLRTPDPLAQLD